MAVRASFLLGFVLLLAFQTQMALCKPSEEFLRGLVGCHKGQNIKGVSQVKKYLENFGYLRYGDHANNSNNDEYDDIVESAVKTYQLNYHLNQTGILDAETLNEMIKPRCGVADIINGTTRMQSGKKKPTSLRTVSHFAFFSGNPPPTWDRTALTYKFRSTVEVVDIQTLRYVISNAFSKWEAVTQFTFTEAQDGSSSDIEIGFHRLAHDDNAPFDGLGDGMRNTLAHAYPPTNGRFHYDADESWSTNPSPNEIDLESVAVHEIGHLLGLDHSEVREAVMFSGISPGVTKRDLASDDIQGIRTLYRLSS
ncbi:hypothetical protein ACHQM5_005996 [Ranunculus cassubicifolius]